MFHIVTIQSTGESLMSLAFFLSMADNAETEDVKWISGSRIAS